MLSKYRQVFAGNSAWRFSTAGFIARLPISMVGIGVLMYVEAERGSYAIAGAISGSISIAAAIGGPLSSRLIDRLGQHRVLPIQILIIAISSIALVVLIPSNVPAPYLFIFSIASGLAYPSIGALVRSRWTALLVSGPILLTAFSIESIIDELIFIVGPTIAATTSVKIHPAAPQVIAIFLLAGGGLWLASMRSSEPPVNTQPGKPGKPVILQNGLIYLWGVHIASGVFFGAVETSIIAYTKIAGKPIYGGIVIALWSFGSLIGGVVYGGMHFKSPLHKQLIVVSFLLVPATTAMVFVNSIFMLALLTIAAGIGVSPLLIASAAITQRRSPVGRTTEAIASMYAGIGLGFAFALAMAGWLIDNRGTSYAFALGALAALVTFAITIIGRNKFSTEI
jgi:MFS family permease